MTRTHKTRRTKRAGYTMIEVVMSMGVLTVGAMGLASMQHVAATANQESRRMTTAATVARVWVDRLRRDSLRWTVGGAGAASANLTATQYLVGTPVDGTPSAWSTPVPTAGSGESYAFDHFGNDTGNASGNTNNIEYCVQSRTRWVVPGQALRADVRVWWHRQVNTQDANLADRRLYQNCGIGQEAAMDGEQRVRFLNTSVILRRNPVGG